MKTKDIKEYHKDIIVSLYKDGASIEYLAQDQGINRTQVRAVLSERNVTLRGSHYPGRAEAELTICDMYRDGVKLELISSRVMMSQGEITRILKKYGLKW